MPRVNFTGRKKIPRHCIKCYLSEDSAGKLLVSCTAYLESYEFPVDSSVSLEAYFRANVERIQLQFDGTTAIASSVPLALFHPDDSILFRLKVASESAVHGGLLLGTADRVRPESEIKGEDKARKSLLSVRPDNLGEVIWKLSINDDGDAPVLLVNKDLVPRSLARDTVFSSLIYPEVLRTLLTEILIKDDVSDIEDMSDWHRDWISFAVRLPGVPKLPAQSDLTGKQEWIETAVRQFARKMRCLGNYLEITQNERA
jgi:hypothetical protein